MMIILGRRGETRKWIMQRDKNGQYPTDWWKSCILSMPEVIEK